tara:strand:+ start:170 stop:547 length:378 start_codon:yes stop_codon:yes gene_type:complete
MSIDQRQFEQLSEMGISLWQRRDTDEEKTSLNPEKKHSQSFSLNDLINTQCFNDILIAFNLTIGEIKQKEDHLDLGLLNWYFTENSDENDATMSLLNNTLITPHVKLMSQSVKLKKQLWQLISQQ